MTRRRQQFQSVVDAWDRKDLDFILDAMTDDIVWHYFAGIAPPLRGKSEVRAHLSRFFSSSGETRLRIITHAEDGDRLFIEGVDEVTPKEGAMFFVVYAGVVEFRGDRISGWRDYGDSGAIKAQRMGEPKPPYLLELAGRASAP